VIPRQFVLSSTILIVLAIGLFVYVWQLRRRELLNPAPIKPAEHVIPPVSGPTENVTVYVAHDDTGELHTQSIAVPLSSGRQQKAERVLAGLLSIYVAKKSPHPLAPGSEIRSVYLIDPGIAVIDVNSDFLDGQTSGILAEELTVVSVIQTLTANVPGLLTVKILAGGKERETLAGHADLSAFYDVSQVAELSKQLSTH
jgi:hypothetical protein